MKDTARLKITAKEFSPWQKALIKYFTMVGLCAHLEIMRATPAIEFKRLAMEKVIKELNALEAKT